MPNDPLNDRWSDGGPLYVESTDFAAPVVEPYNAISAALFVVVVVVWVIRLWGRFRAYPLLTCCLPILLVGGIGGTLYHATRASVWYFRMDVIPIAALGAVVSIYLWIRLAPKVTHLLGFLGVLVALRGVSMFNLPTHWKINLSYVSMALLILVPTFAALVRTGFRHSGWVWTALALFVFAFFFRSIDVLRPPVLPMGTHWLWHTFGALTTLALSEYLYRIEGLSLKRPTPSPALKAGADTSPA